MKNIIVLIAIITLLILFSKLFLNNFWEAVNYEVSRSENYRINICEEAMQSPITNKNFIEVNCK